MKILGLDSSPRDNGNTEKLVHVILEGAASNGMETRFYKLAKMNISFCDGCMDCREKGICGIKDDMQILYDEIQNADAIVLGSPVYMWQLNAQAKAFLDRLVVFIKPDFSTRLKGKKRIVLAFTQGNADPQAFQLYFDYLEKLLSFLHYDVKETIVATGTRDKDDILGQAEVLKKAKAIGKLLAS